MKFRALAVLAGLSIAAPVAAQDTTRADNPVSRTATPSSTPMREQRLVVDGLNRFGSDLYAKMRSEKGDIAFSPASISTAFGLAFAGAKGPTAKEIAATLHYPALPDFHAAFGDLLGTMQLSQLGRVLAVNNAIWLRPDLAVQPDYAALVERHYAAGLRRIDFRRDPDGARQTINTWVEDRTNRRIRDLLSPLNVTSGTQSVLVNTIYFKADWEAPFEHEATRPEDFALLSGSSVKLPLMNQRGRFSYAERGGVKMLLMPYRGGETEMLVLLPSDGVGLASLEKRLVAALADNWVKTPTRPETVIVTIPKFRIEKRYEMKAVLESLGMATPFSDRSDFSGMKALNARDPLNLKIDEVVHQVFVEVDERGTEAAAATAILGIVITGMRREPPPKIFRADHPFVFVIRDRRTGANLFIGRYTGQSSVQ